MLVLSISIVALIAIVAFIVFMVVVKARVEKLRNISIFCLSEWQKDIESDNLSLDDKLTALYELKAEINSDPSTDALTKEVMTDEISRLHFTFIAQGD